VPGGPAAIGRDANQDVAQRELTALCGRPVHRANGSSGSARTDVLRFFALNVVRLMPAAKAFLAHRDQVVGTVSWPELRTLAADSANYLRRQGQEARPALQEAGKEGANGSPSPTG
jgi:hypothetical protein